MEPSDQVFIRLADGAGSAALQAAEFDSRRGASVEDPQMQFLLATYP